MAVSHKLALITVAAALAVATVGCGSSAAPSGQAAQPAAAQTEEGTQKKIGTKLQNGRPMNAAERGAAMSAKGHGEP